MRQIAKVFILTCIVVLNGCSFYQADKQQGNVIKAEEVAKLKEGMAQVHVRRLLGSPMLNDPFHANRWDYYYSLESQTKDNQRNHLIIYFNDKKEVIRWEEKN